MPPYWPRVRKLNTQGPPRLGVLAEPPALRPNAFDQWRRQGMVVLDCRSPEAFAAHIPGALNAGAGASFPTWAGTILPADTPYLLALEKETELWDICWHLLRIGYDLPRGWLAGGMQAWRTAAKELTLLPQWTVWELQRQIERERDLVVLDVRQPQEWTSGHIPQARHITGAELPARFAEVPANRPVAVICGSGYRSSAAASLLQHHRHPCVFNILGGMTAWKNAKLETTKED